jgi:hypothetical protein
VHREDIGVLGRGLGGAFSHDTMIVESQTRMLVVLRLMVSGALRRIYQIVLCNGVSDTTISISDVSELVFCHVVVFKTRGPIHTYRCDWSTKSGYQYTLAGKGARSRAYDRTAVSMKGFSYHDMDTWYMDVTHMKPRNKWTPTRVHVHHILDAASQDTKSRTALMRPVMPS